MSSGEMGQLRAKVARLEAENAESKRLLFSAVDEIDALKAERDALRDALRAVLGEDSTA